MRFVEYVIVAELLGGLSVTPEEVRLTENNSFMSTELKIEFNLIVYGMGVTQ